MTVLAACPIHRGGDSMGNSRATWTVPALVVAHVVLHLVIIRMVIQGLRPNGLSFSVVDIAIIALYMLVPGQGMLLAFWIVYGSGWRVSRGLAAVAAVVYVWCVSVLPLYTDNLLEIWAGELGSCAAILAVARCTGLKMIRLRGTNLIPGRFQFYIRDMLVWTTAFATGLSTWHYLPESMMGGMDRFDACTLLASLTLVAGVSMFSALGRGWIVARIVRLPVIIIFAAIMWSLATRDIRNWWWCTCPLSLMALWLVASFLVLRYAGYRLAWRPRLEQPREEIAT
jgi:hypothetical protein